MEKRIDLHIHTNISDGVLSPKEVIDIAVKNNVKVIAITDHDSIDAYHDELFDYAKQKNLLLIPGVEISTKGKQGGIHVLGYNFNLKDNNFRKVLTNLRNARHDYLYNVSVKIKELGYVIHLEELNQIDAVTKAHIALDVVSNEENRILLTKKFGHIPSKGEFIETIMNEGCPAYVKKASISPKEAAELIRNAGGKVVLAHPVAYKYEDGLTDEDILELVHEMKVQAIEANYLYVDRDDNKIDECDYWRDFAQKNGLICSIGSDFHNEDRLRPTIGFTNCQMKLSKEYINTILNYILK